MSSAEWLSMLRNASPAVERFSVDNGAGNSRKCIAARSADNVEYATEHLPRRTSGREQNPGVELSQRQNDSRGLGDHLAGRAGAIIAMTRPAGGPASGDEPDAPRTMK